MKLGIKGYARHRKELGLPGGSPAAVRKALERGQIRKTLDDLIDVQEADRDWPADETAEGGNCGSTVLPSAASPPATVSRRPRLVPPSGATAPEDLLEEHRSVAAAASEQGNKEPSEFTKAKIRKENALARMRELEVEQLEGTLIPLTVHEERVENIAHGLASRIKNLGRYQGSVQRAETDIDAMELLERIQEELLDSLLVVADELDDLVETEGAIA